MAWDESLAAISYGFFDRMKITLLSLAGGVLLAIVGLALFRIHLQHEIAERIKITGPGGIAVLEKVRLGGLEQWIQIRGADRSKPILLFLHSGPGVPEMPFSHVNAALERDFVVVHWDQRGAGKSYSFWTAENSMTIDQFISDTHELSHFLLERFGGSRLFLVAHSWGSIVGTLTVARYPELFHAYVGIGQVANPPGSEKIMYRSALDIAQKQGNEKATAQLKRIGVPPYKSMADYRTMNDWVHHFLDGESTRITALRFARLAFSSPAYSWADLLRLIIGMRFSFSSLWREAFYQTNLPEQAPRIEVPAYFFLGRHDHTVTASAAMAEEYFRALDAPQGKELVWFEQSDHWPQLQEPEKYREELRRAAGTVISPALAPRIAR